MEVLNGVALFLREAGFSVRNDQYISKIFGFGIRLGSGPDAQPILLVATFEEPRRMLACYIIDDNLVIEGYRMIQFRARSISLIHPNSLKKVLRRISGLLRPKSYALRGGVSS